MFSAFSLGTNINPQSHGILQLCLQLLLQQIYILLSFHYFGKKEESFYFIYNFTPTLNTLFIHLYPTLL